jgi:hypothetical protein
MARALSVAAELSGCSIRCVLLADVLANLLQFEPDCGDRIAALPGIDGHSQWRFPLSNGFTESHRLFWRNRDAHV